MIKISITHSKVFVIESTDKDELNELKKACRIFIEDKYCKPAGFRVKNLYVSKQKAFPTGYLGRVLRRLNKANIPYELNDTRNYPGRRPLRNLVKEVEPKPWDHQAAALLKLMDCPVGLIALPTGTGKSRIIEDVILNSGLKTLLIVPNKGIQDKFVSTLSEKFGARLVSQAIPVKRESRAPLLSQAPKEFADLLLATEPQVQQILPNFKSLYTNETGTESVAFFSPKKSKKEIKQTPFKTYFSEKDKTLIYVLCYQSLGKATEEFLASFEMVIVDECHHAAAESVRLALFNMPSAAFRYGFSATPWRDKTFEEKLLEAAIGSHVIFEMDAVTAIEKEIIVRPDLNVLNPDPPEQYIMNKRDWRQIVELGINTNFGRNKYVVKKAVEEYREGGNVFVAVDEVLHLEILVELFKGIGVEVIPIHGSIGRDENRRSIRAVGENSTGMISIGTMAVGEGVDMPNITCVILASGGKGSVRFLQRIGRGLRTSGNKQNLKVYDFFDWFNLILRRHSASRQKLFEEYFGTSDQAARLMR